MMSDDVILIILTIKKHHLNLSILHLMQACCVEFIDCAGYWDLASEFISIIFIFVILLKTFNNYRYLQQQKSVKMEFQTQKSLKRKIIVNIISILYQISLLLTIIFSIAIFFVFQNNSEQIKSHKLNSWYKWSEIIFINFLNALNLTVGFLYWKAVRAYFKMSQQKVPFIYSNFLKVIFILVYCLNGIIILLSLVLLINCDETIYSSSEIKTINLLNAIGITVSSIMCISSRILYQKDILNNILMNRIAIKKEVIYSILIGFCCLFRIIGIMLNLGEVDYTEFFRYFNQNCVDVKPYHALFMLSLTLCVNLLPPFIFSLIFSSNERKRKYTSEIQQILRNNNQDQSTADF